MSKQGFSFGLKKSAPPKAPLAARRKPAPFGRGGDEDGSDDESAPQKKAVAITELDGFDIAPSAPIEDDADRRKKNHKKPKPGIGNSPPPPPGKAGIPTAFGDLSSALQAKKHIEAAESADPSIYDYDGVYDALQAAKAKVANKEEPAEKKQPKYFNAILNAASQRERDHQIQEEKRLKREREKEGDEFADKEMFVTEAYKRQQEENRRLEEEEKKREEAEQEKNKNKGMAAFYKQMLDRGEAEHEAQIKAAKELQEKGLVPPVLGKEDEDKKSAAERAKEINAKGGNVLINDDGEVVDKRQLLKGGLNVAPKKKVEAQHEKAKQQAAASAREKTASQSKGVYAPGGKQAMRERQTRMLEAQLEETLKRSRQEEAEETAKIELATKSRKTEADISSAKERYLARKRAEAEAKKNGSAAL
ncbi:coiled-coil domain-containing protein 55-domain containing protein [Podospora australis]|uniref:Coiled-coil domain-containing protein 55-domain containing protein n=1 Tax=Podospora australis TaxID=1536484 RepID=A0AAN7AGY1_9PEZI|nr:coiled-coil domain-containing protein 55-domain containing protein [Podospora australis]